MTKNRCEGFCEERFCAYLSSEDEREEWDEQKEWEESEERDQWDDVDWRVSACRGMEVQDLSLQRFFLTLRSREYMAYCR